MVCVGQTEENKPRRLICNDAGYPGCEFQIREALAEVLGRQKSEYFFDKVSNARIL